MGEFHANEWVTIEDGVVKQGSRLQNYYESDQGVVAREALQRLVDSPEHITDSAYYGNDDASFVQRHLHYLGTHAVKDLNGYISNLKLMTRASRSH